MKKILHPALTMLPLVAAALPMLGGTEVRWMGEMRRVMRDGDLTDRADMSLLAGKPHVYALGPLSGLRGELTVFDSRPSVARVGESKAYPLVAGEMPDKAPFLVWAQVEKWRETSLSGPFADLESLGAAAARRAKAMGVDTTKPFPFLVRGVAVSGGYHVVNRQGDAPHSRAEHVRIQVRYPLKEDEVKVLGFWSDKHEGVWTHHGERVHAHVLTVDGRGSGHLDALRLAPGARLSIP